MTKVVEINSRQRLTPDVWQCQCGGYEFWLYADASVRCADCKREAVTMQGYWRTPVKASNEPHTSIHHFPSVLESDRKSNSS